MPAQNKLARLHILLTETKLHPHKADIVFSFTNGRSKSSRDLTEEEADQLINYLVGNTSTATSSLEKERTEKMKRKLLSMAHQMGWKLTGGKIDMAAVDSWCIKYGQFKKPLDAHSYKELPILLTQFEFGPYKSLLKKL